MVPYPYNSVRNCGQYLGYFVIINKQQAAYRQAVIFMCLSMEDIILHLTSPLAPVKDKWFPISELIVDNCEHYWNHSNQWFIIHTSQRQIISSVFSYNWYTPLSLIWISLNIESAAVGPDPAAGGHLHDCYGCVQLLRASFTPTNHKLRRSRLVDGSYAKHSIM